MTSKAPPQVAKPKPSDIELEPDAWERFEATVNKAVRPRKEPEPPEPDAGGA